MKKLSFKLDVAIYVSNVHDLLCWDILSETFCGSFSHDTVGARSKSFPQTQTTYVFISRLAWNWNMAHGNLELLRSGKLPASSWRDGLNRLTWTRLGLKGRMHVIHKLWQITLDVKEEKITFRLWLSNLNMFWLQLTVLDVFVYVIIQKKTVMTNLQVQIWTRFATL